MSPDDKIPPLICQRCLDKVNYYSDFLESVDNSGKQLCLLYGLEDGDCSSANSRDGEEQHISYEGLNSGKFESDDSDVMNRPFNTIHTRKSTEDLLDERKKWLDVCESKHKRDQVSLKSLFRLETLQSQ